MPSELEVYQRVSQADVNAFHRKDDVDVSWDSHHHTLGKRRNQAAPGDHTHPGDVIAGCIPIFGDKIYVITDTGDLTYGLGHSPLTFSEHVYLNGILLTPLTQYTITGTELTLDAGVTLVVDDVLVIKYAYCRSDPDCDNCTSVTSGDTFDRPDGNLGGRLSSSGFMWNDWFGSDLYPFTIVGNQLRALTPGTVGIAETHGAYHETCVLDQHVKLTAITTGLTYNFYIILSLFDPKNFLLFAFGRFSSNLVVVIDGVSFNLGAGSGSGGGHGGNAEIFEAQFNSTTRVCTGKMTGVTNINVTIPSTTNRTNGTMVGLLEQNSSSGGGIVNFDTYVVDICNNLV